MAGIFRQYSIDAYVPEDFQERNARNTAILMNDEMSVGGSLDSGIATCTKLSDFIHHPTLTGSDS